MFTLHIIERFTFRFVASVMKKISFGPCKSCICLLILLLQMYVLVIEPPADAETEIQSFGRVVRELERIKALHCG